MGSGDSTPIQEPILLDEPWREVNWSQKQKMLNTLKEAIPGDGSLRILVVGPAGSGKSCFISSVNTAIRGHNTYIARSRSDALRIACKFDPSKGLIAEKPDTSQTNLNTSQSEDNKVHCMVFVVPADITDYVHYTDCRQTDGSVIPKVVIMTKVDKACPYVKKNLQTIYTSKKIKETMEKCSVDLNVPLKYIFPVKNYYEEINSHNETNVLLLTAISNIVNFAKDLKEEPWRPMTWNERGKMLKELNEFQSNEGVEQLRILVVGPAGAGKSTFITSVNTALQGRSTYLAHSLSGGTSVTSKYTVYKINKCTDGAFFPFVFGDTMGLETDTGGAQTKDIVGILHGAVQGEHNLMSMQERINAKPPSLGDKVHCLVFVLAADTVAQISNGITGKMKEILQEAQKLGIPIVVILSKVDKVCQLVQEDLKMIYTSRKIKDKMEECSTILRVPVNYTFPVKNYHQEIDNNGVIDVLLLKAVMHIVNFANDFVKNKVRNS